MAYTSIKLYPPLLHGIEYGFFSDEGCSSGYGLFGNGRVWGADDTNANGGVDSVGETNTVADCRAILECA